LKLLPIDYERCCIDRLNPPPKAVMRYELSEFEWAALKPMLPNKPRGVPRVNDRRVLNGIFWVLVPVCVPKTSSALNR